MRRAICIGLVCLFLLGLTACAENAPVTREAAIGTWKSEEIVDGSDWITYVYLFDEDNTFIATKYVNGAVERVEQNTWKIEEGKLLAGVNEFTMKDGKLICDGHGYTKQ